MKGAGRQCFENFDVLLHSLNASSGLLTAR